MVPQPAPIAMRLQPNNEIDQIRRFLKLGDSLNTNTLKQLKEDPQIQEMAKNDRSSASLYKSSRYINFSSLDNPKHQEIRKIYQGNKKQKIKPMLRMPLYRNSRLSQEVQTEQMFP